MPNRIIKESVCTSENIDLLTTFEETVFYRLLVNCDDFGRMDARIKILKSRLFPLKDIKTSQIEEALRALVVADLIVTYEVDGKPYLQMKTWDKHQQVRAKKSKYPSPNEITCNQLISNDIKSPRNPIQYESNPNPNTNSEPRKRFNPPTLEEVTAYCTERNNGIDPQYFYDYQTARNWTLSNGKRMADWRATIRTWERNNFNRGKLTTVPAQDYHQRDYSDAQEDAFERMMSLGGRA